MVFFFLSFELLFLLALVKGRLPVAQQLPEKGKKALKNKNIQTDVSAKKLQKKTYKTAVILQFMCGTVTILQIDGKI